MQGHKSFIEWEVDMCLRETNEAIHGISWVPVGCFASNNYGLSGFPPNVRRLKVRELTAWGHELQ